MKVHHFDEHSLLWRKISYCEESCLTFIVLMKKNPHSDEKNGYFDEAHDSDEIPDENISLC